MAEKTPNRSRRTFNAGVLALGASMLAGGPAVVRAFGDDAARRVDTWQSRLARSRRLFCIAYITPDAPGQGGQEATVARYPLAVVPQENRAVYKRWRERVRELNPDIVLLGYQMTIEETTVPGPGHDVMRKVADCWASSTDGSAFSVDVDKAGKKRRVYDPRKREWQSNFVEACQSTLAQGPYEGLFLDQCTIYDAASPDRAVREDMRAGIQEALSELRRREPNALVVANSAFTFRDVNGELNESRPRDYAAELSQAAGHTDPQIELAHVIIESAADRAALKARLKAARDYGAYFGAGRDYQHVEWYEEFDIPLPVPNPPSKPIFDKT